MPVLNATPRIYLGKKRKLKVLKHLFKQSLTTKEVEEEISRLANSPEALQLRNAIQEGGLTVEQARESQKHNIEKLFPEIDEGEAATIALALNQREPMIIVDDAEARTAAEYFQLETHGTIYLLLEAYKQAILPSKKELIELVNNMITRGFYLSTEVYSAFLSPLRQTLMNSTPFVQSVPSKGRVPLLQRKTRFAGLNPPVVILLSVTLEFDAPALPIKEKYTLMQQPRPGSSPSL